jgi:hypothetical protein
MTSVSEMFIQSCVDVTVTTFVGSAELGSVNCDSAVPANYCPRKWKSSDLTDSYEAPSRK